MHMQLARLLMCATHYLCETKPCDAVTAQIAADLIRDIQRLATHAEIKSRLVVVKRRMHATGAYQDN